MVEMKSILFVRPDYHCSFFYRDEFRKRGWKADIIVDSSYPSDLLYSKKDILTCPILFSGESRKILVLNRLFSIVWWIFIFWKYKYHVYYGRPPFLNFFEHRIGLTKIFGYDFSIELWLSKFLGIKLVYLPTGCHDFESKVFLEALDSGNVCSNCGAWDRCFDELNDLNFSRVRRFFDMAISEGIINSSKFKSTHMKYKVIDLDLWSESIHVPSEHLLPFSDKIRILHSAYLEGSSRNWRGRNIKGSPYVLDAVKKLQREGYPVEYFFVKDKPSNVMRFYQAQADIVVEQLIYGWWGSTFVEASALGKPVVCYLRKSWKEFFFKVFVEYKHLPIVEADTSTIYEELKRLVVDADYRARRGEESRLFAEQHFDVQRNTSSFIEHLEAL